MPYKFGADSFHTKKLCSLLQLIITINNFAAALVANYVKVVEDRSILYARKMLHKNLVFSNIDIWRYSQRFVRTNIVWDRHLQSKTIDEYCATAGNRCDIRCKLALLLTNSKSHIRAFDCYQN